MCTVLLPPGGYPIVVSKYIISTVPMVTRTRLNVTLFLHCLSCFCYCRTWRDVTIALGLLKPQKKVCDMVKKRFLLRYLNFSLRIYFYPRLHGSCAKRPCTFGLTLPPVCQSAHPYVWNNPTSRRMSKKLILGGL
jgi:hypothetical protein